ncbi:MAG: 7-carboxy-7-deazaguanine synthase QueE [Candidatus Aminicenantales bacterium]
MPQPPTLKVAEIFPSLQGEGLRQGEPTIFVRLTGCNLRCAFCDTKYAWEEGKYYSVEKVLERIQAIRKNFPAGWVCLTGGEPLCQDLSSLVSALKKKKLSLQLETNATFFQPLAVDWYSISPKPPQYYFRSEYREKAREVKVIVTRELEINTMRKLRESFPLKTPLILQPQSSLKWSIKAAYVLTTRALKEGLGNVRLSVQLHKVCHFR